MKRATFSLGLIVLAVISILAAGALIYGPSPEAADMKAIQIPVVYGRLMGAGSGVELDTVQTVATGATDTSTWVSLAGYRWPIANAPADTSASWADYLVGFQGASGDSMLVTVQTAYDPAGTITSVAAHATGTGLQRVVALKRTSGNVPNYLRVLVKHEDVSSTTTRFIGSPSISNGQTILQLYPGTPSQ